MLVPVCCVCLLRERKRYRKHPVKHVDAAVGYFFIVIGMKTKRHFYAEYEILQAIIF